jgi:hypothetical protein
MLAGLSGALCQTQRLVDPLDPAAKPTQPLGPLVGFPSVPHIGGDTPTG